MSRFRGLRRPKVTVALGLVLSACGGSPPPQAPEQAAPAPAPANTEAAAAPEVTPTPSPSSEGAGEGAPAGSGDNEPAAQSGSGESHEFKTVDTHTAKATHGAQASKLTPTKTEALLKLVVVDKAKGPIAGIVVSLTGADGKKFYAPETDATGYAEVLVPAGQKYELMYLSLGHQDVAATTMVDNRPRLTMKLTLRFKGFEIPPGEKHAAQRFVLDGVNFDSGKATIRTNSFARLDTVVEYLAHKKTAYIEISGHTDNVGNAKNNKALSEKRAEACRDYVVSKGIDGSRVEAVGYGDERPIAPNDTAAGRQKNRRIEATEL